MTRRCAFKGTQKRLRLEDKALSMIEGGKSVKEVRVFLGVCDSTARLRMRIARNRRRFLQGN